MRHAFGLQFCARDVYVNLGQRTRRQGSTDIPHSKPFYRFWQRGLLCVQ